MSAKRKADSSSHERLLSDPVRHANAVPKLFAALRNPELPQSSARETVQALSLFFGDNMTHQVRSACTCLHSLTRCCVALNSYSHPWCLEQTCESLLPPDSK